MIIKGVPKRLFHKGSIIPILFLDYWVHSRPFAQNFAKSPFLFYPDHTFSSKQPRLLQWENIWFLTVRMCQSATKGPLLWSDNLANECPSFWTISLPLPTFLWHHSFFDNRRFLFSSVGPCLSPGLKNFQEQSILPFLIYLLEWVSSLFWAICSNLLSFGSVLKSLKFRIRCMFSKSL